MQSVWLLLCTMLVAACGRLGFDGSTDARVTDDAFAARICDRFPQAIYCTDFEDGTGELFVVDGAIAPTEGFGGSAGMVFEADPGESPRATHAFAMPIVSAPLYIAGRVNLAAGAFVTQYLVLAQVTSANTKISFDLVDLDAAQIVNDVESPDSRQAAAGSFPRGRWACFEMMIDVSAASAAGVTLTLDGQQVLSDWQGLSTLPSGGWTHAELGAFSSPMNTTTARVVFDNWVVQASPIGCP